MSQLPRALLFPRLAAVGRLRLLHTTMAVKGGGGDVWWGPEKAAGREVVGFGARGDPSAYSDRLDYWYPTIRFRKEDDVIAPIRTKEKGDWKKLTLEEKKLLYRYSYKATLAEFLAPTGYWKPTVAWSFAIMSLVLCYFVLLHQTVYKGLNPPTMANEYKEAMLERQIDLHSEPITGPASKWDYEKKQWKK